MKTVTAIAAAGLATFGFVSSASAFAFDPPKHAFTATGSLTVTAGAVSLPCTAVLKGTTSGTEPDQAVITSADFSGLSCLALTPGALPWAITISGLHNIVLHKVEVSATVLGICGPGNVPAGDSSTGKLTISGAGLPGLVPCSVSGTFTTHPRLIVDKGNK